jgi:two-component system sensor histidine kinase PilS (NtrC family)
MNATLPEPSDDCPPTERDILPDASQTWHPLYLFNLYRLFLSGGFTVLVLLGQLPSPLGAFNPKLFEVVSLAYFLVSSATAFAISSRRPGFNVQLHIQVFSDIGFITLLMFASGGIASGVGMLLVVTVAGGALLSDDRIANLFAAMATIAVLSEELYTTLNLPFQKSILIQAGIYGIVFFITAVVAGHMARRLRQSQALAQRRGADLANLAQTNAYIIRQLQAGILVLDALDRIHIINSAAWNLLGQPDQVERRRLRLVAPPLADRLEQWRRFSNEQGDEPDVIDPVPIGEREVLPRFTRLGDRKDAATLVFLEDTTVLTEQAQQAKLAGLGRLTASIAHEIRNPLGAISHAAQLMEEESTQETGGDPGDNDRLLRIILDQSQRVNTVIESVLTLSRRSASHPRVIELKPELERCSRECLSSIPIQANQVVVDITPPDLRIYIDPTQLSQVLWNLCSNAVHQFQQDGNALRLRLEARHDPHSPAVILDVVDNGPGIPKEMEKKIFEPFVTATPGGTGLGLYMSRELCESNHAELSLVRQEEPGARFRIRIPDRGFLFALKSAGEETPS